MSDILAFSGPRIFDGTDWHTDAALLVEFGYVSCIVAADAVPANARRVRLDGGMLVPGFIDLQVNGGGGVMFNDHPSLAAIRTICAAHARFGTTGLLATLISDQPETTERAIAACREAHDRAVPGFLGLHLEGPHLSRARRGAHDHALIRPMSAADLECLVAAAQSLPSLLCTMAPEAVTNSQIAELVAAGARVSLGHSEASHADAVAAFSAGASMVTHLFNAMSQMSSREPGLVGAALDRGDIYAGLIADGIHVHPATLAIALRAKRGPGRLFLVTDAMAQTGTDMTSMSLHGRTITRAGGALRLADGTLAGADLDMMAAVNFVISRLGLPLDEALRMASLYPAGAMGMAGTHGHLLPNAVASFVHLSEGRKVHATWINGEQVWSAG